ncbi:hypothetical protein [Streptomyces sp. ST2-7A]|uniref:hypothetical protein n=1 Tax=Streptomyces sp. ST2-7A TaxID=2907214 RepID=UPI001F2D9945|nr:hypothetical protein [Streptomyces sp. ST2-7A]MCE7081633.1 hypothetical protein [Streptomyces sp. ST2-7A]
MVGTTPGGTLRTFREACRATARSYPGVTLHELTEAHPFPHSPPPVAAPVIGRALTDVHAATTRDARRTAPLSGGVPPGGRDGGPHRAGADRLAALGVL